MELLQAAVLAVEHLFSDGIPTFRHAIYDKLNCLAAGV